jgi:hypothetical protein
MDTEEEKTEIEESSLTLEITETFKLVRFEIDTIRIIPHRSASIDITIFGDNKKQYSRTFFLIGQAYLDYQTDCSPTVPVHTYTYVCLWFQTRFQVPCHVVVSVVF